MVISSPDAAEVLTGRLSCMLHIVHTPMPDRVAMLDMSSDRWVLYLDSGSPLEDLRWALLDVISVLANGRCATTWARPVSHLRLVREPGGP
jgi:hypothetical protein